MIFALALSLGVAASVQAQTRTITNQLVVHLTFDDTMNDNSGRTNNATYTYTGTGSATPIYVAGKIGDAFKFTTVSGVPPSGVEYASLGYPDDLKFGTTTDFSVAFWTKANASEVTGDPVYISNKDWDSAGNLGWGIFAQGSGDNRYRVQATAEGYYTPSGVRYAYRPTVNVNDGAWHHIVVTYQRGGNFNEYFDGVLKNSSGFNPAYIGTNNMDTYALGWAVNIGQDGAGVYSSGIIAAIDDVGLWRRVLTPAEVVAVFNYAQLGTNLFNVPDVNTPILLSFTPQNGAVGVVPNIPTTAVIQDQTTQLDTNSVQLFVDGLQVAHTLTKNGAINTIAYTSPFLFPPLTTHTNKLVFADNGTPLPTRSTNVCVYTLAVWTNIYLGTPIYVETFDELTPATNPPAVYPAGWTVQNCTDPGGVSGWNLFDARSDTYLDWQIVPIGIVAGSFNYDDRIRNVNGAIVANGVVYPVLGSNNIAFGASDQRSGSQVDYMFTGDYDLTGKTNIWVAYNNMYSQETYQLGALEYSINQGATWLPIVYMLDTPTIVVTNGVVDPYTTLTTVDLHIPYGTCGYGNTYGAFIGVDSSLYGTLGPYISARTADDHVANHKIEQYRLPQADGQAKVRFRFAMVGANYWDWGFDNFGIYTMAPPEPPNITSITSANGNITINWNGTGANAASGLQKTVSLSTPVWSDVPGTIGLSSYSAPASGAAAYYRAVRY
jgi:hypothetical protein